MIHVIGAVVLLLAAACGDGGRRSGRPSALGSPDGARRSERSPALGSPDGTHGGDPRAGDLSSRANEPKILFLGTSLTAGLGVSSTEAYPWLIQRRLDSLGLRWHAVNGGLSGETSAGLLRRMDWLLAGNVRILIIETGANDGLRGLDVDSTRANIEGVIARARAHDSTTSIVLAGMEVPPNLGARYATRFRSIFRDLARRRRLTLIPFLLERVGGIDSLNQADGIHPNPTGHRIVAETVWKAIEPIIRQGEARAAAGRTAAR